MISELAYIGKGAKIGKNVTVEPFAYIADDVVIGDDCYIYAHATILDGTRMGNRNKVHQGAVLGSDPQDLKYKGDKTELIIGDDCDIRENVVIARATNAGHATQIGNHCHLMDGVHICHGAVLKDYVMVGLKCIIGGNSLIESYNVLSNAVIIFENVHIGEWTLILSGTRLRKDVPPYIMVKGNPASYHGVNTVILQKNTFKQMDDRTVRHIMNAYLILYHANVSPQDAAIRIENEIESSPEIDNIINFINHSKLIV
ncbi:MAG: acyl-ACP--UDP-N-acetylglucosamine O-acyltransferase [Bacteroidaceae bacterium]|nr:acyl-ACP--UDP-N-acetylglucosamine O-acyltransferase [Bacteroidaceae bacterium]